MGKYDHKKKITGNIEKINRNAIKKFRYSLDHEGQQMPEENQSSGGFFGFFKKIWSLFSGGKRDKTGRVHDPNDRYGKKEGIFKKDVFDKLPDDYVVDQNHYFNPFLAMNDKQENAPKGFQSAFNKRVNQQIGVSSDNDYYRDEKEQLLENAIESNLNDNWNSNKDSPTLDPQENLESTIQNTVKEMDDYFNLDRAFRVDYEKYVEGIPDRFKVAIGVNTNTSAADNTDNYSVFSYAKQLDMKNGNAEKKAGTLFDTSMKNTEIYAEIKRIGEEKAQREGYVYDEETDPNMFLLKKRLKKLNVRDTGHASVALQAFNEEGMVSQYSFGFNHINGNAKGLVSGGRDIGVVQNPDSAPVSKYGSIMKAYDILYKGYIQAAAKIRGIIGSGRTYQYTGYNCASFAIDIANTAGANIPLQEVQDKMADTTSDLVMVETPMALLRYLRRENDKEVEENLKYANFNTVRFEGQRVANVAVSRTLLEVMKKDLDKDNVFDPNSEDVQNGTVSFSSGLNKMYLEKLANLPAFASQSPEESKENALSFYNQLLDYAIGKMTYLDDAKGEDRRKLYAVREEIEISSEYINDRRNMQARIEQMRKFFGVESVFEFLRLACLSENGYNQAMNLMGQN